MQTVYTVNELREQVYQWRQAGLRIAFAPTMGSLHEGHLRLVDAARQHGDRVLASIFVNPMQFGEGEDFEAYSRSLDEDSRKLSMRDVDLLFAPEAAEVYPGGIDNTTRVEVPGLTDILCGVYRPGHFSGVATVVAKLFNLVQPDVAVFGEKDFQQLAVIRRMVGDLNFPVEVVGVPTVRESDGLAMSSRNAYLTPQERRAAPMLYDALREAGRHLLEGVPDYGEIEKNTMNCLERAGFRPEYVSIRRASDLQAPAPSDTGLVILAAAWLGRARLIDNLSVGR